MRRFLSLLTVILFATITGHAREAYYYRTWTTTATVSPDNTWTIDEEYDVTFTEHRHGIFRYIQNQYGANRNLAPDGQPRDVQYRKYHVDVKVLSTSGGEVDVNPSDENDCTVIRWGDPDRTVYGDKSYGVTYTYRYPDDRVTARDYLFHTLLPNDVRADIQEFRFVIDFQKPLPKGFDDVLKFYYGIFGGENMAQIEDLVITTTRISGVIRNIPAGNALTLYGELPEGYYEGVEKTNGLWSYIALGLAIALALLVLYYEFTDRGPSHTSSVQFYAPEGLTPILVGKIIDDSTDNIDLAALIPWLGEQGYITIREIPKEKGLFGAKADIELTKLRDASDSDPDYVKEMMYLLFHGSDTQRMNKLGDRHSDVEDVKKAVDKLFTGDKRLTSRHHTLLMLGLIASSTTAILLASAANYIGEDFLVGALIWCASFLVAWGLRIGKDAANLFRSKFKSFFVTLLRLTGYAFVMMLIGVGILSENDLIIHPACYVLLSLLCLLACEMADRNVHDTPYRAELAGKLKGFREFIDTAEKNRLQMLVDKDPQYFYHVLPYAMIFGMTDKWAMLFSDIRMEPASWYYTANTVNAVNFATFNQSISHLSSSLSSAISTTAVDHTKSSSSGGGGGGYSGGGGGGGGAGSW